MHEMNGKPDMPAGRVRLHSRGNIGKAVPVRSFDHMPSIDPTRLRAGERPMSALQGRDRLVASP
ncbi:hypothetical protein BMS3Abin02_00613 [bacterium BMS3Abin02]|nr:hypothetical protein BMS3Abin02_00613 [bacterium BMS3Abin02]GBE22626.1 hypothetical protein BMS3Bbin01_02002 [bacterium BMS3Bbin01]